MRGREKERERWRKGETDRQADGRKDDGRTVYEQKTPLTSGSGVNVNNV